MQHYGVGDASHVVQLLKRYPELMVPLNRSAGGSRMKTRGGSRIIRPGRRRREREAAELRFRHLKNLLFESMDVSRKVALFSCPICRNVLNGPITVECGHTFCKNCLDDADSAQCVVCATEISASRCINVLLQDIVQKWRERNAENSEETTVPDAAEILGIRPRYQLRSGFAGLQIDDQCNPNVNLSESNQAGYSFSNMSTRRFAGTIKNVFKEVESIQEKAIKCCWDCIAPSDLECILCSRCIFDPITTACGHTFCKGCLTRVLDHGLACPLCMAPLSVRNYFRGSNVVLDQAIRFLFPEEYKKLLMLNAKEIQMMNKNSDIPVFICTNAFPGVACPLYVYEPRYRLLVRRCLMSHSRRFAMAAKESSGSKFVSYGTVLEVKDAVSLEDGSFILTTVGMRRFKVINKGEQDGYDIAKVQFIRDTAVPSDKLSDLVALHQKVYNKASKWITSLTPKVLAEVERLIGQMPSVEKNWLSLPDGPSWTWWLMPILPLSSQLQVGFLSTSNLEKRLRAIDKMLERMEIRMKALERNTMTCSHSKDSSDSCSESENFAIPMNH